MPAKNSRLDLFKQLPGVGRLDELITVQLRRVDLFLSQAFDIATDREKFPNGVITSLALVVANPGISQNDVSRSTGIDKSGLVAVIDYLEDAGWIVRERSRVDRRRNALRATAAGEARLENLVDTVRGYEEEMLAGVSQKDLAAVRTLLDRMFVSCLQQGVPIVRDPEPEDEEPLRKFG